MEIQLTRKEYRLLLNMLAIAEWVMTAMEVDPPEEFQPYHKLLQKFYGMAEAFESTDLIQYDSELKEYFLTSKMDEEEWWDWMEKFTEDTFWDELITRLAEVHVIREIGRENAQNLPREEIFDLVDHAEDVYRDEFIKNGLENVYVKGIEELPLSK